MALVVHLMCWLREQVARFRDDIRGVSTVEYALIVVAVIAIVGVAAGLLGDAFTGTFEDLSNRMTDAAGDVSSAAAT